MRVDPTKPDGDEILLALGDIRLIVFDCDGTLIDSQHNIVAAVEQVFASIGLMPPPAEIIRRQVGLSAEAAIAAMLPDAGSDLHQQVISAFHRLRPQLQQREKSPEPLYPGILPLLRQLEHPELFLGIATGKSRSSLLAALAEHGLTQRFHTLQTGDRSRGKPHPEMLLRAISETGLTAAEAVMLGDTTFDMEMARAAGCRAVGVSWGYHRRDDLERAGADAVIDHPGDLLSVLRRLA